MYNAFCSLGVLLVLAANAAAAELHIGEFSLGTSAAQLSADPRVECNRASVSGMEITCNLRQPESIVIGGVPLRSLQLHQIGGRVVAIEAIFPEPKLASVLSTLAQQFGAPVSERERLRAGMGGVFDNAIHVWRSNDALLRLEQFFRNINRSSLILTTDAYLEKLAIPKITDARTGIKEL